VTINEKIEHTISAALAEMGYNIVRVQISGNIKKTLQIMIERTDGQPVTVDHCAEVSRYVGYSPSIDGFIVGAYNLEVSSPGLDRPLTKIEDYKRFQGYKITLKTIQTIENRKHFSGLLESADDLGITVFLDKEAEENVKGKKTSHKKKAAEKTEAAENFYEKVIISYDNIGSAKLKICI